MYRTLAVGGDDDNPGERAAADDPGETLVAQFHFDEFVDFFQRRPRVAMKLFKVFVQASTSKLKEWRLRTMIARRALSQGAGAGAFVGVGGGGAGTGTGPPAAAAAAVVPPASTEGSRRTSSLTDAATGTAAAAAAGSGTSAVGPGRYCPPRHHNHLSPRYLS